MNIYPITFEDSSLHRTLLWFGPRTSRDVGERRKSELIDAEAWNSEFLEQMRRHGRAIWIAANPLLKLRVCECVAKTLDTFPHRVVEICGATAHCFVHLRRWVAPA